MKWYFCYFNIYGNYFLEKDIATLTLPKLPNELAAECSEYRWDNAPHIIVIGELLSFLVGKKNQKLIVNMPPRHGKSELISRYFPFWYLMHNPTKQIIFSTYDQSFAATTGRFVRDLVKRHGKRYGIELRRDASAKEDFLLTTGGGMISVGAGGSLTGRGADLLIIDDPIKNDMEATSNVIRDNIWQWFNTTAFTRIEPGGMVVVVMTRWHEDDLCGRILKQERNYLAKHKDKKAKWTLLKLPAIATEQDVVGRKVGEPLWANRYDLERLGEVHEQMGDYWFNALYQQTPQRASGNIFKRKTFKYFNEDEEYYVFGGKHIRKKDCSIFAVLDLAATISETSDWTAVIIFALTPEREVLVLEVVREKFEGAEHLPLIRNIFHRWRPLQIGIESVQYQISLVQLARKELLPVRDLRADRDKVTRSLPMAAMLEAGKCYFREGASWLTTFEDELLSFPKSKNDDQVDAFSYIAAMLRPLRNNGNEKFMGYSDGRRYVSSGFDL
jgi:predicted phage terminase large subunit-like protein